MIEVKGIGDALRDINVVVTKLGPETERALFQAARLVTDHMKQTYLTSGPLHVRTGRLRGGWTPVILREENGAAVVVATKVKYARVHNYGFRGPVYVKEHVRSRSQSRRTRRPRSTEGKLRLRAEGRARRENAAFRSQQTRAAHGLGLRQLQARSRGARRARGLQGGVEPSSGRKVESGKILVRAHGRFMKIRGHLYVERSLADTRERVLELLARRLDIDTLRSGQAPPGGA